MPKKIILLIFAIVASINVFGQFLYIGGQDFTNKTYFVQTGTQPRLTIDANLVTATNSLWNSLDVTNIIPVTPVGPFPFLGSGTGHHVTVDIKSPGGKLIVKFVMPDASIKVDSIMFQYVSFPVANLANTSVSACGNDVQTFHATTVTNTEYVYSWEQRSSTVSPWVTSPDGSGNNLTLQMVPAKQGYEYRCILALTSCATCTDTTGIITIQSVGTSPTASDLPSTMVNVCGQNSLSLSTNSVTGANYQWYWLNGTTWVPTTDGPTYTGSTTNTLNILDVQSVSGTRYVVRVNIGSCYIYGQ